MDLTVAVYAATIRFPASERYGLASQLQRAAVSIPSNIAEGHSRRTRGEFVHFLGIALGSLAELETQIQLARRLGFATEAQAVEIAEQAELVGRLVHGLTARLGTWRRPPPAAPTPPSP